MLDDRNQEKIRMNLLFITRFYPDPRTGGIERVTKLLAEYFSGQGIKVYCLYFEASQYDGSLGDILQAQVLAEKYDRQWMSSYLKDNKINVVINQSHFFYSPFLAELVHDAGAKLITCCHSSTSMKTLSRVDALKNASGAKRLLLQVAYPLFKWYSETKLKHTHSRSFEASDKTIVLSKSIAEQYREVLGIAKDDKRLDYISNPLSFEKAITDEELATKENVVLVVARLYEPQKRLSLLFKAWAIIESKDWKLIIVGDGEDRKNYEKMVKDLGLDNVQFEGTQNSETYYRKAKIFAMTSEWEGLPMTILESFQMGVVPVVMDSFPAAKDLIVDGKNGFLVEYGDVKTYAEKLRMLMTDETVLEHMVVYAKKSSEKYSIGNIMESWNKMLNR